MSANRPKDTAPEVAVRSELHRAGLRFRKHLKPIPRIRCEVDIAFTRWKLAVFVDGCFWHGCPQHKTTRPVKNAAWWSAKLDGNVVRDRANDARLSADGWTVLRCWEHESTVAVVQRVIHELERIQMAAGAAKHGSLV
jgi:DNA mismatch endonuclease (patch repair protein)